MMSLQAALDAYLAGLWPEFSEDIPEPETISRSANFREIIEMRREERIGH